MDKNSDFGSLYQFAVKSTVNHCNDSNKNTYHFIRGQAHAYGLILGYEYDQVEADIKDVQTQQK